MRQYIIFFIIITLITLSICQDSNHYQCTKISVGSYFKISIPSNKLGVTISVTSIDGNSYHAYPLNYSHDSFKNSNVLNQYNTNFNSCNITINIDNNLNYDIIIENEHFIKNKFNEYFVIYCNKSSSVEFFVDMVIVYITIFSIVGLIIYALKK